MMLVGLHTVFMREHNRIAMELSKINSHWDDERIFQVQRHLYFSKLLILFSMLTLMPQETRSIVAALVQQITYNEFLPMVLGKEVMERFDLLPLRDVKSYSTQS